ncbi:hypothetical protein ICW40_04955 [Actinotalea ferrariae]|nr:hypothetical protein [Actinotalea ferrariae]
MGTVVFAGVVVGAGAGVAAWLRHLDAEPLVARCSATSEGTAWHLEPDQADTAALLAATSVRRSLPARATTIAIATGLQESKLRNITYGDRDSLGIFQQRPSQGWGTEDQVLDPVYATNAFYDALVKVDGYQDLPVTEAAQAVQRSGFPEAYAQHEGRARAWASAMYGFSPGAVTCTLPRAEQAGDVAALTTRVERDFGALPTTTPDQRTVDVDASGLGGAPEDAERMAWIVAHWAVSVAGTHDVVRVQHGATAWQRDDGAWAPAETEPAPTGVVRIELAA